MSMVAILDGSFGALVAVLGGFIYWQFGRRTSGKIFAFLCLTNAVCCGSGLVYFGPFSDHTKGLYVGTLFIFLPLTVTASYHTCLALSRSESRFDRQLLKASYVLCFAMAVIRFFACPPSQFHTHPDINSNVDAAQGVAYLFVPMLVFLPLYSDYVLFRMYRAAESKLEKNRLIILLTAQLAAVCIEIAARGKAAIWEELLAEILAYGTMAYLIARHRLFDFSFTLRKGEALLLVGLPLALLFCGFLYLAALMAGKFGLSLELGSLAAGFALVFAVYPLYQFLEARVRVWLNIRDLNSPAFQAGYSNLLMRHSGLQGYLNSLLEKLEGDFSLKNVGFLWRDSPEGGWVSGGCRPKDWHPEARYVQSPLFLEAVSASPGGLYLEEVEFAEEASWPKLKRNALAETMRTLGCEVVQPLQAAGWLQGVLLLGGKTTGRIFNPDEFGFFNIVGDHLSVALDRGRTRDALAATDHAARHDALTGLPNRKHFNEALERILAGCSAQAGKQVALLFMDLDLFKWINDNLGHAAGDSVLCIAAQRMRNCVPTDDLVVRLGGDEFVIVAAVDEAGDAQALCQRLLHALGEEMDLDGVKARIGCSIGVSLFPRDARDKTELVRKADEALYLAKVPRNVARFYNEDVRSKALEREELKAGYEAAFGRGEFLLHYQPQWDVATMRVVGAEALLRWEHPERGLLSARAFMNVVEELGVQDSLGLWEFEQAARQAKARASAGRPSLPLAVNLSPKRLQDPRLAERLLEILRRHRVEARNFRLEISETAALKSSGTFAQSLKPVRRAGMGVFLDEFMGHAGINALQRLNVDGIKISRGLVHGIGKDREMEDQLKASMALGRSLGMDVVALGIESREQLDYLKNEGCSRIQGNYCGAPTTQAELEKILEKSGAG